MQAIRLTCPALGAFVVLCFSSPRTLHAQCPTVGPLTGPYILGGNATGAPNGPFTLTATNSTYSFVELVPTQTITFGQLTSLSANFTSNSGGSGGGTPRILVGVNNGGTEDFINIYLGNSPAFTDSDAVLNTYSGFNVIGNNDAGRYDTSGLPGGSPSTTYSGSPTSALTLAGPLVVEEIDYVTDTFSPFPSRNETLFSINGVGTLSCQPVTTANGDPDGPFQVRYAANLVAGESYIEIINDGFQGASLLGPGFGAGTTGNICVSVYAIDPGEELDSCCSCLVTPDQVVHLGAVADLISNTANGVKPTSLTIKLIASVPTGGASATSCATQAATATATQLVSGMDAWGTTLHADPVSTTFDTIETPFTNAALSAGELASLTGRCASIIANLSGAGICTSCHNGALGAAAIH